MCCSNITNLYYQLVTSDLQWAPTTPWMNIRQWVAEWWKVGQTEMAYGLPVISFLCYSLKNKKEKMYLASLKTGFSSRKWDSWEVYLITYTLILQFCFDVFSSQNWPSSLSKSFSRHRNLYFSCCSVFTGGKLLSIVLDFILSKKEGSIQYNYFSGSYGVSRNIPVLFFACIKL